MVSSDGLLNMVIVIDLSRRPNTQTCLRTTADQSDSAPKAHAGAQIDVLDVSVSVVRDTMSYVVA